MKPFETCAATSDAPSADLVGEARYFYRQLIGGEPSSLIICNYVRAHEEIAELRVIDAVQRRTVDLILASRLDAMGIEPWLRRGRVPHALGIKLRLLTYLGECGANHPKFKRQSVGFLEACTNMGFSIILALFSLLRGYLQKLRHGLL